MEEVTICELLLFGMKGDWEKRSGSSIEDILEDCGGREKKF